MDLPGTCSEGDAGGLVAFFLQHVCRTVSPLADPDRLPSATQQGDYTAHNEVAQLASESTAMLRTLLHSPTWRPVVVPALDSRLDALCDAAAADGGAPPVSVMVDGVAALAVLGGLPESLRPGGVAWLDSLDAHQGLTGVIAAYSPSAPKAQIALHGDAAGACAWFVCAAAFPRVQPPKPDPSPRCAVPWPCVSQTHRPAT